MKKIISSTILVSVLLVSIIAFSKVEAKGDVSQFSPIQFPAREVTTYGGCEDVRVDSQGYAMFHHSVRGFVGVRALDQNLQPFKPVCNGGLHGGIGGNEAGSVSYVLLSAYDTKKHIFSAYPYPANLPQGGKFIPVVEGNAILKNDYCFVLTNPKNGQSVRTDIVDRGPKKGQRIDASAAAWAAIGINPKVNIKQKVNAILSPKTGAEKAAGQCANGGAPFPQAPVWRLKIDGDYYVDNMK